MDINLKNKLDTLLMACNNIGLKESVIQDILSYIAYISEKGSEERCSRFSSVYLGGKYAIPDDISGTPKAYEDLCNTGSRLPSLYASFIFDLSKYYLHSKYDRKDINSEKIGEYMSALNERSKDQVKSKEPEKKEKHEQILCESHETSTSEVKQNDSNGNESSETEESLDDLFAQLDSLIGMDGVKKEIHSQVNLIKYNKLREERGFGSVETSKHLVFLGNPGTGKTTIARLLAKMYKQIGVLETGQLVEVDRGGLVAGYVGQTAERTKEKIAEAMGGILFIDEAYTLAKGGNDFGQEAIDTLLKAMEDERDKFVVIVAGYPEPMNTFLDSNPGLRSRFNKYITFEDYSDEELYAIFESICKKQDITLTEEAKKALKEYLTALVNNKPEDFGNGREMRNLFESSLKAHSDRVANIMAEGGAEISNELLNGLDAEDLQFKEV